MQQPGDPAGCGVGHRAVLSRREKVCAAGVRYRLVKMPAAGKAAVDRRSAHEADVIAVARQRLAKRRTKEHHVIRGCDSRPRGAGELYLAWTEFDLQRPYRNGQRIAGLLNECHHRFERVGVMLGQKLISTV